MLSNSVLDLANEVRSLMYQTDSFSGNRDSMADVIAVSLTMMHDDLAAKKIRQEKRAAIQETISDLEHVLLALDGKDMTDMPTVLSECCGRLKRNYPEIACPA